MQHRIAVVNVRCVQEILSLLQELNVDAMSQSGNGRKRAIGSQLLEWGDWEISLKE